MFIETINEYGLIVALFANNNNHHILQQCTIKIVIISFAVPSEEHYNNNTDLLLSGGTEEQFCLAYLSDNFKFISVSDVMNVCSVFKQHLNIDQYIKQVEQGSDVFSREIDEIRSLPTAFTIDLELNSWRFNQPQNNEDSEEEEEEEEM
jgi:hypothetical protein